MANDDDARPGLSLTSRSILRDGAPWIPVTGELHYSRQPRGRWADALRLMKAGGVNVVSTYIFWIRHQPVEEQGPDFQGSLDLAAFVRLCQETGLEVILRVGPWCHGEVRNGGHPDWIVNTDYTERTNDPRYLDAVRDWFAHIGAEVAELCGEDGPVVGIQLENELYDQPDHILELKNIARSAGLHAPLWTATAWGSADIPVGEVFPLYGGYADGFWVDTDQGWDESFQTHFTFSHQWDDPGIGKDLAGAAWTGVVGAKHPDFPAATCELGGGMAKAYHRRPVLTAKDIAAVALCKIGSGSAWQGYYMYAGGTNPGRGMQESQATGYPNDLPELNYDFGAPLGAHLQVRETLHRLRNQHSFLAAFGGRLGAMNATIPEKDDDGALRWALRSDGSSGFIFINNHRPYEQLPPQPGVQFELGLGDGTVRVPHRPVDIPAGEFMAWPVRLDVNGVVINWATLNVITLVEPDGEPPVLVLAANDGVARHLSVPTGYSVEGHSPVESGTGLVVEDVSGWLTVVADSGATLRVLVLTAGEALTAWTPTVSGRRHLVLSEAAVVERDGGLEFIGSEPSAASVFPPLAAPDDDGFSRHPCGALTTEAHVSVELNAPAALPTVRPITVRGRASAPSREDFEATAARFTVTVTGPAKAGDRSLLRLELVGDVASSSFEGREEDVYWDGCSWDVDITPAEDTDLRVIDVRVYPLAASTPVWLPEAADRIRRSLTEPTAKIVGASVISFTREQLSVQTSQARRDGRTPAAI